MFIPHYRWVPVVGDRQQGGCIEEKDMKDMKNIKTYLAFRTFRLLGTTFGGADIGFGHDGLAASPAVLKHLLLVLFVMVSSWNVPHCHWQPAYLISIMKQKETLWKRNTTYLAFRAIGLLGTTDSRAEILRQGQGHGQRSSECENRKANHCDPSMRMQY